MNDRWGLPIDPNAPKPVTTAEVKAASDRARESGDWSEVSELSRRPRLATREELDQMIAFSKVHGFPTKGSPL